MRLWYKTERALPLIRQTFTGSRLDNTMLNWNIAFQMHFWGGFSPSALLVHVWLWPVFIKALQYYEWLTALCLHVPLLIMCTPTYNIFIATLFTQRKISENDKKMSAGLVQSSWCARFIFLCMNYVRYITKVPGKVSTAIQLLHTMGFCTTPLPHFLKTTAPFVWRGSLLIHQFHSHQWTVY